MSQLSAEWELISGRNALLARRAQLECVAKTSGYMESVAFLEYFLEAPHVALDVPHSLLRSGGVLSRMLATGRSKVPHLLLRNRSGRWDAAVLLFEYRLYGIPTGLFMPIDADADRTVIAQDQYRAKIACAAGELLVQHGALMALVSYREDVPAHPTVSTDRVAIERYVTESGTSQLVATRERTVSRRLALAGTLDETLATMGPHTRRNLRAFQRRAIKELGVVYHADADATYEEFSTLNKQSRFPVNERLAMWRYQSARQAEGAFLSGLQARDGRWISLIGGHRQAQTVWLDWQMNLTGLGSLSIVSAMRAFLLASEISRGMEWMLFEGGTPHSISGALLREPVRDLLFTRRGLSTRLIRLISDGVSPGGPLMTALASEELQWLR